MTKDDDFFVCLYRLESRQKEKFDPAEREDVLVNFPC